MAKMIRYARNRATLRLVGSVLRENEPMLKLARDIGFEFDERGSAPTDETRHIALVL